MRVSKHNLILGVLTFLIFVQIILLVSLSNGPLEILKQYNQFEGKKSALWKQDIQLGKGIASCVGIIALGFLMLIHKKWRTPNLLSQSNHKHVGKYFYILILTIVTLGTFLRWNLWGSSLWWDEAWNVRENSHGKYRSTHDNGIKFHPTDWQRAAWYYPKPTHHAPIALASKACLTIWHNIFNIPAHIFSEKVIRLPCMLASLLSIGFIGILLKTWGHTKAGVIASFILAIHPWHIRHGIEARGFSFVVLGMITALIFLTKIIETKTIKERWLFFFGFSLFLLMWSFPSGIWYPIAFVLVAPIYLKKEPSNRLQNISSYANHYRLLATCILAGVLFLHCYLPALTQAFRWKIQDPHFLCLPLISETWSAIISGSKNSLQPLSLFKLVSTVIATGISIFGITKLRDKNNSKFPRTICLALLISALCYLITTWSLQHHFYHRYLIHLLPIYIIGLSIGILAITNKFASSPKILNTLGIVILLLLACFPFYHNNLNLIKNPFSPIRDIAQAIEKLEKTKGAKLLGLGHGSKIVQLYKPDVDYLIKKDTAQAKFDEVLKSNATPIYVFFGHKNFNLTHYPAIFEKITKLNEKFEKTENLELHAIENNFTYEILRIR